MKLYPVLNSIFKSRIEKKRSACYWGTSFILERAIGLLPTARLLYHKEITANRPGMDGSLVWEPPPPTEKIKNSDNCDIKIVTIY